MPAYAYYNEFDPYAAQWLRNLISAGRIAPGDVDERSIEDVRPEDLSGYTQCHFFAGIGVWSHALRRAGWPDDRPVWTGSAPCQPFSAAGRGTGFADKRHLWPAFHYLIEQCRPVTVIGEQVASKDGLTWLDLVHADMEGSGYTLGALDTCAAGVGAPHIRQRLYWMAHAASSGRQRRGTGEASHGRDETRQQPERFCDVGGLAHSYEHGRGSHAFDQRNDAEHHAEPCGESGGLGHPLDTGLEGHTGDGDSQAGRAQQTGSAAEAGGAGGSSPTNGFWRAADWLYCRDGRWRPVEPGTSPLAHGTAGGVGRVRADKERLAALLPRKDQGSRAGRLKGYGNAIVAPQAVAFIECVIEEVCQ